MANSPTYGKRITSSYKPSQKTNWFGIRGRDNYNSLYRELTSLHHEADAEDLRELVTEINTLDVHKAQRRAQRRDFLTHSVYVTLDKAIAAYRKGDLKEDQFNRILTRSREQLSEALHESSPEELHKKKPGELRLVEIVNREVLKQAAAILSFILALLSFDQVRLTGAAIGGAGSYDYYSLFGFLFLALGILFLLMRKDN